MKPWLFVLLFSVSLVYPQVNCDILKEGDPRKLHIGMRVEAVLKEKREGNIGDILYFKTIK